MYIHVDVDTGSWAFGKGGYEVGQVDGSLGSLWIMRFGTRCS